MLLDEDDDDIVVSANVAVIATAPKDNVLMFSQSERIKRNFKKSKAPMMGPP